MGVKEALAQAGFINVLFGIMLIIFVIMYPQSETVVVVGLFFLIYGLFRLYCSNRMSNSKKTIYG